MKYDKIVGLKKQQEKENLEIIQREIDAMLEERRGSRYYIGKIFRS